MSAAEEAAPPKSNRRPADVTSLIIEGEIYSDWRFHNKGSNRFYLVNLHRVLDALDVEYTNMKSTFDQAEEEIRASDWPRQCASDWVCGHNQLRPQERDNPKTFSRAVIIIVALEIYGRTKKPSFNVYDHLRIIPAFYCIDGFTETRLASFEERFPGIDPAVRERVLGSDAAKLKKFSEASLAPIGHGGSEGFLEQLAAGFCITQSSATAIVRVIGELFSPNELPTDPVRRVGEEGADGRKLYRRRPAAPALRIKRSIKPEELVKTYGYLE